LKAQVMKKLTTTLLAIAVFGFFQHARAASFDCKKAGNKIERAICQDPEISMLDEELSKAYKVVREREKEIVKEQRAWLKIRNKCADTACLKKTYSERVAYLVSRSKVKESNIGAKFETTTRAEEDKSAVRAREKEKVVADEAGLITSALPGCWGRVQTFYTLTGKDQNVQTFKEQEPHFKKFYVDNGIGSAASWDNALAVAVLDFYLLAKRDVQAAGRQVKECDITVANAIKAFKAANQ
jgi:uncharacterized protein